MTLIDTNVLVDVLANNAKWVAWSADALDTCASHGPILVNEIVYAELAVKSESKSELDSGLNGLGIQFERTPQEALYLAGKVFGRYRSAGGTRAAVLPDFFIGAHAQIARLAILTRDRRRYSTYFPDLTLITPEE